MTRRPASKRAQPGSAGTAPARAGLRADGLRLRHADHDGAFSPRGSRFDGAVCPADCPADGRSRAEVISVLRGSSPQSPGADAAIGVVPGRGVANRHECRVGADIADPSRKARLGCREQSRLVAQGGREGMPRGSAASQCAALPMAFAQAGGAR